MKAYKDFYSLSLRINTVLKLDKEHRQVQKMITEYENLFNESRVNGLQDLDKLVPMNKVNHTIINIPKFLPPSPLTRSENKLIEFKTEV